MPFYYGLKSELKFSPRARKRCAAGIVKIKEKIASAGVPRKDVAENLLVATWNIREFDSEKYGARCEESYYYIAEIIDHFDLVAIQEVRGDLAALKKLQNILGGWWKYIVTDITLGQSGNDERLAFLFDTRKVVFSGLAGELVLPNAGKERAMQFARTPFICGFKAGWTEFNLCTVHIYYGKAVKEDPRRVKEIEDLAGTLAAIADGTKRSIASNVGAEPGSVAKRGENLIILGDFNIFNRKDRTFSALEKAGFKVPEALQPNPETLSRAVDDGSNLDRSKHYDQIAFKAQPGRFGFTKNAGIFDFQSAVFAKNNFAEYDDLIDPKYLATAGGGAKAPDKVYNDWRTYQMSDHLLMWAELRMNYSREYLAQLAM